MATLTQGVFALQRSYCSSLSYEQKYFFYIFLRSRLLYIIIALPLVHQYKCHRHRRSPHACPIAAGHDMAIDARMPVSRCPSTSYEWGQHTRHVALPTHRAPIRSVSTVAHAAHASHWLCLAYTKVNFVYGSCSANSSGLPTATRVLLVCTALPCVPDRNKFEAPQIYTSSRCLRRTTY
jgi:hypothetical protein